MNKLIILSALIWISGCSTVEYRSTPLSLPSELRVPVVKAAELECVTDETFKKLKLQNELLKARIETLKNIIKSTHVNR